MRLFSIVCLILICFTATTVFASKDDPDEAPTVTSPNGRESWKSGTTKTIKWSKGSGFNFVKIQLFKSGKHYKWISKKTKNDGKYPWKIPSTVKGGSAYKIKIVSLKNKKVFDKSNGNFTITAGGTTNLKVTSPKGDQSWTAGKTHTIKWKMGNAGASVKIYLTKSGKYYKWISKKTKNDGKHRWEIPTTVAAGSAYRIKIVSTMYKNVFDSSNRNFTIKATSGAVEQPVIGTFGFKVIRPNGGETWKWGKRYAIKWDKEDMIGTPSGGDSGEFVRIFLLKSTGKRYQTISEKTANDGKHPWVVPTTIAYSTKYKIRVQSLSNQTLFTDDSNNNFTIGEPLAVTAPNGGESLDWGKTYAIKWDKSNAGSLVRIRLLKFGKHDKWISKKTKNDGKYPWKVSAATAYSTKYKIRVQSYSDSSSYDDSDANFTIGDTLAVTSPNGGESLNWGKSYAIKWDKGDAGQFVRIFLLKKTGKRYKTISKKTKNDGKYLWKVPKTVASSSYKIRVQSVSDSTQYDDSDASFTIGSTLEVTSPNGGESWNVGSTYTITWNQENVGNSVGIYLYNSGNLDRVISSATTNDGSYSWSIPSTATTGSTYKIRVRSYSNSGIYDESDSNFAIEKESLPSGDYQYLYDHNAVALSGYTIRWNSKTIQVSGASGTSYWRDAVDRWPTVSFSHVSSPPSLGNGIEIVGYEAMSPMWCGYASYSYYSSGKMASCKIRINPNIDNMGCGPQGSTMTHEVGHCIGILRHSSDGGLMDAVATGSTTITSPIRNMISLLYSLDPGTDINSELSRGVAQRNRKSDKYDRHGKKRYYGVIRILENGVVEILENH